MARMRPCIGEDNVVVDLGTNYRKRFVTFPNLVESVIAYEPVLTPLDRKFLFKHLFSL